MTAARRSLDGLSRILETRDDGWLEARERGLVYVFSHFPIHIGIVALGVGISAAIEAAVEGHALAGGGLIVLCAGVGAFLLGASVCHRVLPNRIRGAVVGARLATAAVLFVLPFAVPAMSPLHLVGGIAVALLGLIVFEARATPGGESETGVEA